MAVKDGDIGAKAELPAGVAGISLTAEKEENDDLSVSELRQKGIFLASIDALLQWGRGWSLYPFQFGLACCAIEMICMTQTRYDCSRFGYEVFRNSPRQADVMIIAGTVTEKMRPCVERLYHQIPEPRWVVAVGSCAISGGPFVDSYSVVPGADSFIPVDVYVPGCPPRPEAIIDAFLKLKYRLNEPARKRFKKNAQPKRR